MKSKYDMFTSLIAKANRCVQKIKNFEMEEVGLKGKQVQCLFHLYNSKEGLTSTQLCLLCGEDKAAISRTIKELENLGYVFFEEQSDKVYKNPIKLTNLGEKIGELIMEKTNNFVELGGEGLSEQDRKNFYASLTLICDNLQKICDDMEKKNG